MRINPRKVKRLSVWLVMYRNWEGRWLLSIDVRGSYATRKIARLAIKQMKPHTCETYKPFKFVTEIYQ